MYIEGPIERFCDEFREKLINLAKVIDRYGRASLPQRILNLAVNLSRLGGQLERVHRWNTVECHLVAAQGEMN